MQQAEMPRLKKVARSASKAVILFANLLISKPDVM